MNRPVGWSSLNGIKCKWKKMRTSTSIQGSQLTWKISAATSLLTVLQLNVLDLLKTLCDFALQPRYFSRRPVFWHHISSRRWHASDWNHKQMLYTAAFSNIIDRISTVKYCVSQLYKLIRTLVSTVLQMCTTFCWLKFWLRFCIHGFCLFFSTSGKKLVSSLKGKAKNRTDE